MLHEQGISSGASAVSASLGTAVFGTFAALDPSIANIALAVIGAVVVFMPLWFKYKTDKLRSELDDNKQKLEAHDIKIEEVIKTSDGMKDALVKATADASLAKGVLVGIAQADAKSAVISAAILEGRAQAGGAPIAQSSPPLLPSQVQPIAAKAVEGVKLTPEQIEKMIAELQEQLKANRVNPPEKPI